MKIDENNPAVFVNSGLMDEEECLGAVDEPGMLHSTQPLHKQTLLTVAEEDGNIGNSQADRWRTLSTQIRGAIAVRNAVVKPNKRRSARKSTTNIDPFLQKFSTREIGLTTQVSRASLGSVEEEKDQSTKQDNITPSDDYNYESGSTYLGLACSKLKSPTGIIDPDGSFLYYWLYFVISAIRYNFWVIILRFAFLDAQEDYATLWWVLDTVSDLIYLLDIGINCRVGFVEEGILVKDSKRVCRKYLKSLSFCLDVLSVLPLELLYFHTGVQPILRFPRLLKVYKSQSIKSRLEGRANHPTIVRVFFLIHLMILLIHWNAGIYFLISRAEGFGSNNWLYPALNGSYDTLTRKYVYSFYWSALTLTTIGDLPSPETNVEYIYTIFCYLSGVFVFAMIVGNAGSIILDRNASRMDFQKQRDNAKNYMEIHNVPRELQRRVLKWYDYSWSRGRMSGGGGDLNSFHLLPDKMKTEIALHVHLETLKKVTFLQNCEPEFLHELLLKMKLHIFTPGDLIIRHGEIAREMYLIANGRIEVISETGSVLKELGSGDFFGEIGILSLSEGQNRRTADVRSIGYTECFVLSKDDVLGEIQQFPLAKKILAEYGRKRLQNTSGDPRLVKLDDNETPPEKASSEKATFHVVDIAMKQSENDTEGSEENEKKLNQDGRVRGVNKEHGRTAISNLFKATKELVTRDRNVKAGGATVNGFTEELPSYGTRDRNTCGARDLNTCGTRDPNLCGAYDLNTCLNTLDNLKAVLQKSVENEIKNHKDYISRLECQLEIEKEKNYQSEQKIKTQEYEISELTNTNKILEQSITDKDIKISEMEYAFPNEQDRYDVGSRNLSNTRANETELKPREAVLSGDEIDLSTGTNLSPTETTTITICDTSC